MFSHHYRANIANPRCIRTILTRKQSFRHFQHGIHEIWPIKNADRYFKMAPCILMKNAINMAYINKKKMYAPLRLVKIFMYMAHIN